MQQVQVEKNYQRCATGIYQEVQDVQKNILHEHDQDKAHSLQQPVDHVELHRD